MLQTLPALTDPLLYSRGDPHAVWRTLRRESPVSWHEYGEHGGYWAVTTHAAGLEVLTDWERFTSTKGIFLRPNFKDPYPGAGKMMALSDPPRHDRLRKAIMGLFTVRAISRMEERTRKVVREALHGVVEAGRCDFVKDIAARIPLAVSAELLSISMDDVEMLAKVTTDAAENSTDIDGIDAQEAHFEILRHYSSIIEEKRRNPGRDLVSALTSAQAEGLDITDDEVILTCDNVIVAANETTRQAVGAGMLALLESPGQWRGLRDGDLRLKPAAEEFLRWTAPVTHILRTAQHDTVLEGVRIRAGDAVTVWLPSLNRDEKVFDRADSFLLDRTSNHHVSFGGGGHFCIGANLARLTIRVLLDELAHLPAEIEVSGEPQRIGSYILGGLTSLPLTFRPS
ncbi:cytochrome P450 [Streptomyces sp. NPDC012389]|uniref:cytochrome P450 n=1 Tax=unclassified Streptomyces TaxID=2593676 RepID=UPI00081E2ACA|nr:cytochrome P450 [Streptomyces sp. ScaeMP-e83]MYR95866.1 cytochrome P450 [Streptomyces sp. SID4937]SCD98784.1 Cytochrome P450 [Streptomyces sp. ScaeMP-e83]